MLTITFKYKILTLFSLIGSFGLAQTNDSLAYYINTALENNPMIQSEYYAYQASLESITQAGAFDDAQLEVGVYTEPMTLVDGEQIADFKLMQMFPWFGSRKAAKNEARHNSNASYERLRATKNNIVFEVSSQWYLLIGLKQQLINIESNTKNLEHVEALAKRKFASSRSSGMSDVLRVQIEIAELNSNKESIEAEIKAQTVKFNTLLNRNLDNSVQIPSSVSLAEVYTDDLNMRETMIKNNPVLAAIREEGEAYKAKSELNRKRSYPMIGLGVNYMLVKKRPNDMMTGGMENMNGMDMIMPMVTITLPVFRKKYNAQQQEGKLWWQSSQEKYNQSLNELYAEYSMLKYQLEDALRKLKLYEKQMELTQTTYNLIIKEFATGTSDLTNVLQVQQQLINYQLKKAEVITTYNTKIAVMEKLMALSTAE